MKCFYNSKGSVLLYLIAAVTIVTALGTGVFYMTTTSHFSGLGVGAQNKARALAESGIRYAFNKLRNRTLEDTTTPLEYKLTTPAADKFVLEVSGVGLGGNIKIESIGISNPGSPYQASHKIAREITPMEYQQLTDRDYIPDMTRETGTSGVGKRDESTGEPETGISVDIADKMIKLGMGETDTYGCVWYQGWEDSNGSECVAGRCNFNKGIRAYFDFEYETPWRADGFTFAIASAHNNGTEAAPDYINNYDDCGGGDCGEYMGYAGPGSKPSKHGLQPPKIAIEFDPYLPPCPSVGCLSGYYFLPSCSSGTCLNDINCKWIWQSCKCSDQTFDNCTVCGCNSRYDRSFISSTPWRHVSLMYWGGNSLPECGNTTYNTYDDNRHGEGDGTTNPRNPLGTDTGDNKGFLKIDFNDIQYAKKLSFRLEIDRLSDGTYKIYGWVKKYLVSGYTDSTGVKFDDTSQRYNKSNDASHLPDFKQEVQFSTGWHDKFDRMLFGFTQATGGETQKVYIKNFQIDFKSKNDF